MNRNQGSGAAALWHRGLLLVLALVSACGGGRPSPPGLAFPRADRLPRLRVERLVEAGAASVRLTRLAGVFRVERVGALVDLPYVAAVLLQDEQGERVRVLFDHHPDEPLYLATGAVVSVRYSRHGAVRAGLDVGHPGGGRHETLSLSDEAGRLLFLAVVRPPDAALSADEELLPPSLRPDPTDERVYREFLRQESYCTTERDHYAARLPDGARWRRLVPGERAEVETGGGTWRVHLVDVSRVSRTDCAERPGDWMAYQVFGGGE